MPRYSFENSNGDQFDEEMSIAELEMFLKNNPNVRQVMSNVYTATRGNSFDYHMDHGMKNMFRALDKQYHKSRGIEKRYGG